MPFVITLRENTERPETVSIGTNILVGSDLSKLEKLVKKIADGEWKNSSVPELWDGQAGKRILDSIIDIKLH